MQHVMGVDVRDGVGVRRLEATDVRQRLVHSSAMRRTERAAKVKS
jgi:hypothetical protein